MTVSGWIMVMKPTLWKSLAVVRMNVDLPAPTVPSATMVMDMARMSKGAMVPFPRFSFNHFRSLYLLPPMGGPLYGDFWGSQGRWYSTRTIVVDGVVFIWGG